jgi:hypothetical protein
MIRSGDATDNFARSMSSTRKFQGPTPTHAATVRLTCVGAFIYLTWLLCRWRRMCN